MKNFIWSLMAVISLTYSVDGKAVLIEYCFKNGDIKKAKEKNPEGGFIEHELICFDGRWQPKSILDSETEGMADREFCKPGKKISNDKKSCEILSDKEIEDYCKDIKDEKDYRNYNCNLLKECNSDPSKIFIKEANACADKKDVEVYEKKKLEWKSKGCSTWVLNRSDSYHPQDRLKNLDFTCKQNLGQAKVKALQKTLSGCPCEQQSLTKLDTFDHYLEFLDDKKGAQFKSACQKEKDDTKGQTLNCEELKARQVNKQQLITVLSKKMCGCALGSVHATPAIKVVVDFVNAKNAECEAEAKKFSALTLKYQKSSMPPALCPVQFSASVDPNKMCLQSAVNSCVTSWSIKATANLCPEFKNKAVKDINYLITSGFDSATADAVTIKMQINALVNKYDTECQKLLANTKPDESRKLYMQKKAEDNYIPANGQGPYVAPK